MNKYYYPSERVAVVAMSCLMPDADNTNILWENILSKKVSIKELPDRILNKSVFYRPDVNKKIYKNDKTYTKIGAVVDELDFSALGKKYKIPPAVAAYMDNNQKTTIYCVDQVMQQMKSTLPKERTAVILCSGAPGIKFENVVRRAFYANVENHIRKHPEVRNSDVLQINRVLDDISNEIRNETQPITEDTATGYLQNITAGRIANIFDFWGPSYIIDSACASSLTAISTSVAGLLNNEYDAVISGGVEVSLSEISMMAFSAINALSPDGSYPFDKRANGFVMGLGGAVVVLKRLSDALRDGDYIYSVISGYAGGSDGKGKYIAAPSEAGQVRTIQNACKMAGYSVRTIEMIEAHGTGTIVGDEVEVSALKKAFCGLGMEQENSCGIGSIKSNIGHLRNAAGVAGFVKATLALQNKILPASANIKEVNPKLMLSGSPFYVLRDNKNWSENTLHPRRANVSAYGFGGANCHICLEEFRTEFLPKTYSFCNIEKKNRKEKDSWNMEGKEEAIFFSGASVEALIKAYKTFIDNIEGSSNEETSNEETSNEETSNIGSSNEESFFEKAVYQNNSSVSCENEWRISICASSLEQLKEKWQLAYEYLSEDKLQKADGLILKGIYIGRGEMIDSSKIAFMFPGQGSQYPNMLRELYETYPFVKSFYMKADALWKAKYKESVIPIIFSEKEEQKDALKNTKNTHPAMFISNMGVYKLLCEAGIKADYMIGHSLGEVTALYAGGILDLKSAINTIGERGFSFDSIEENKRGSLLSVQENAEKVGEILKSNEFKVSIVNMNSSEQTVVGGESEEIYKFMEFLDEKGYKNTLLNVSHAFHTGIVSNAAEVFYERIKDTKFKTPKTKVMACHIVDYYSDSKKDIKKIANVLKKQILSPVRFSDSIMKLYKQGVRVFIEAGPSDVLTNLVKNILYDKDVKIVNVNNKNKSAVESFKRALAALFAYGVDVFPVPSNNILGLEEEGLNTIVYKVEAKNVEPSCNNSVQKLIESQDRSQCNKKDSIVYSGVSIGLPGTFKKAFSEDNFECLSEGKNFIEMLTEEEAGRILDLNITRLIKTEKEAIFKKITSLNEVIHFTGKFGKMDMIQDYLLNEKVLNQMTQTVCAGVAAGYEALRDAGIPLVKEYKKTASGSLLPGRFVLPKYMQDDTGIIFANGLYPIESVISEVSKYTAAKYGSRTRKDLIEFFQAVISKVSDYESKKLLSDWFTIYYSRLADNPCENDVYEFNHDFLAILTSQANNRLAQFIGAKGPNMFLSAACSSTSSAVTVAEDMIRAGHAKRMLVIGADITSGKNLLPWLGAAFSSIGSLSDSDSLFEAAVPFDNRRKGMILGSGAVGLMIEKEEDVVRRGMNGICRILGTQIFNAGTSSSRIDTDKHCAELDKFISKMENEYHLDRNDITSKLVYCSHETYSHKLGGCSNMEKTILEKTFGDQFSEIKIINTKGMTGHTLGASIEEAVSAKALQYQKIPPVVNYREPDPNLEGLNLSKGGKYEFEYVLRTVAAMGGHGNYHLLQRLANGDERIIDKKIYREWIDEISSKDASLKNYGRLLVAEDKVLGESSIVRKEKAVELNTTKITSQSESVASTKATNLYVTPKELNSEEVFNFEGIINPKKIINPEEIMNEVIEVYSNITKYPKEMLELSMEVEADLGIDTVKQATIFSILTEKFHLELSDGESLSNYPTIGDIVALILDKVKREQYIYEPEAAKLEKMHTETPTIDYENEILKIIADITQYPVDLLDKKMEMEADLGIDTVKQATIVSIIMDKYKIVEEKSEGISKYNTIESMIDFARQNSKALIRDTLIGKELMSNMVGGFRDTNSGENSTLLWKTEKQTTEDERINLYKQTTEDEKINLYKNTSEDERINLHEQTTEDERIDLHKKITDDKKLDFVKQTIQDKKTISNEVFNLISQITKYPVEMLEDDMELEADLGIDTIKQATIMSELSERFSCEDKMSLNISEFKTIKSIIDAIESSFIKTEDDFEMGLSVQYPVIIEEKLGVKDYELLGKNITIIGDNSITIKKASEYFRNIASNVYEVELEKWKNPEKLNKQMEDLIDKILKTDVILDCSHLGKSYEFLKLTDEEEKEILYLNSVSRFLFYKKFSSIRPNPDLRIICAVSMDGCFGYTGNKNGVVDPYYGALCGFYKGLRKEFEKSKVKLIDLGNLEELTLKDIELERIADELEAEFESYEIGYADNKRVTIILGNVDRSDMLPTENYDSNHFVITGGGNGITTEIALGISKKVRAKFTILGRTELPTDIEELSNLDDAALQQKKKEMYNRYKKEGRKASPIEVQREYSKIIKAISVNKLQNEIKKNGSDVQYFSCDVTDYQGLESTLLKATSIYGPIHVIIHGAGIENSRLIGQKTKEEFEEVFEVKANGLCNLYRIAQNKDLKALIGFSSISGRFGNEAQLDYCAGNNFITSFMSMIKSYNRDLRAVSISWSGWKDIGMAWRNEFVKENAEEMGLNLIEPDRGTEEFLNILMSNINLDEIVISKGLRYFTGSKTWHAIINATPQIDWVSKKDGEIKRIHKVLSVKTDPIINHHRLGKMPLMPAVGFMEIGAEAHSLIYGKKEQYCFHNITLNNPLKLFNEKSQEIVVHSRKTSPDDFIEAVFYNNFKPKFGKGKLIELNSMKISGNIGEYEYLSDLKKVEDSNMVEISLKDSLESKAKYLNNTINLGPLFMDEKSEKINKFLYNNYSIVLTVALSEEQITNKKYHLDHLLINPAFADSLMQSCGIHSSIDTDGVYLPWKIGEFGIVKVPRKPGLFKVYAKMMKEDNKEKSYDAILYSEKGEVYYYAKNVIVKRIAQ